MRKQVIAVVLCFFTVTISSALIYLMAGRIDLAAAAGAVTLVSLLVFYMISERGGYGCARCGPFVLWLTGLSGSGKSTIADIIYDMLREKGCPVEQLDGDTVRSIFPGTGFTRDERNNHIRRIGYLASILEKNGITVIASFVSPYRESRDFVRGLCNNFIEVYVSTTLEECERRDVKGLYRKARAGEIENFTGIDDPYEPPESPEIIVKTEGRSAHESSAMVLREIKKYLRIP